MASFESIRAMALAFPEAVEVDHHGFPSGRVRGKIYCTWRAAPARLMVKLDPEDQRNLCEGYPELIDPDPGYWGRKGSTFVDYAMADDALLAALLKLAWTGVAPKSLRDAN